MAQGGNNTLKLKPLSNLSFLMTESSGVPLSPHQFCAQNVSCNVLCRLSKEEYFEYFPVLYLCAKDMSAFLED